MSVSVVFGRQNCKITQLHFDVKLHLHHIILYNNVSRLNIGVALHTVPRGITDMVSKICALESHLIHASGKLNLHTDSPSFLWEAGRACSVIQTPVLVGIAIKRVLVLDRILRLVLQHASIWSAQDKPKGGFQPCSWVKKPVFCCSRFAWTLCAAHTAHRRSRACAGQQQEQLL